MAAGHPFQLAQEEIVDALCRPTFIDHDHGCPCVA